MLIYSDSGIWWFVIGLNLKETFSVEIAAVPPFNFMLTVHKPAGWWWSTPDEVFEKDVLWTVTRFKNVAVGLKLQPLGTLKKPRKITSL